MSAPTHTDTTLPDWPTHITAAAGRVYDVADKTALMLAAQLSDETGNTVLLKREDQQPVFSFKLRGAYNRIASLPDDVVARGVICSSAGNHAQGVAMAAKLRGCRAVIVMPRTTPEIKIDAVRALDGEVVLHGDTYDDAAAHAAQLAEQQSLSFVHPFDDPDVIAGQATIGLELIEQCATPPHAVFVPIGGGGLASGIGLALKAQWPETRIIGVEPEQAASMLAARKAGAPVTLPRVGMFADGVAVRRVGDLTFDIVENVVDDIITVTTDETCAAIRDIYEDTRTVVEPAGALAVAAMRQFTRNHEIRGQSMVAIVCGANLNFDRLRHIAERAAIGERREALYAVRIAETPGSFRQFCDALGPLAVTEFNYRLQGGDDARIFVGVALRDGQREQQAILQRIVSAGYEAEDISDNELAKLHLRHLSGGRNTDARSERLFRFEFPERPGALGDFLDAIGNTVNISLFHYRNHGSDFGRVLVGLQIPDSEQVAFDAHIAQLGFWYSEETDNTAAKLFLG
ncbi:MAG: threonine ammonia-lyase, biosynthetic [Pseudomonadota bacterium]